MFNNLIGLYLQKNTKMIFSSKSHISAVSLLFLCCFLSFMSSGCKDEKQYNLAKVTTGTISNITDSTATCSGEVTDEGSAKVTVKGFCWDKKGAPLITSDSVSKDGERGGAFSTNLTGLTPSTLYYIRAYATNKIGTRYGELKSFWTLGTPVTSTEYAINVTSSHATVTGRLIYDGGESVTDMGICYGTSETPTLADNVLHYTGSDSTFTFTITDLAPVTTYYFCSYAVNSKGTSYGNVRMFNTMGIGITDADGNTYDGVQLGNQMWLNRNLKVTKFNDSQDIPHLTDSVEWSQTTSPAWCYYKNNSSYGEDYGVLYNWYAANSDNLCPTGWRVPTDADWEELEDFLGRDAGNKLKLIDDDYWISVDGFTNESNFSAVGSGYRMPNGEFRGLRRDAEWWTSDDSEGSYVYLWEVTTSSSGMSRLTADKNRGVSIRCMRNVE